MAFIRRRPTLLALALIVLSTVTTTADGQVGCSSCSVGNQAQPCTACVQPGQPTQQLVPITDPLRALEEKVCALQCQLESMASIGDCTNCNSCNKGCGGFYVGAAAVFAKPHLKEAFQYSHINFATGTQSLVPFEYDYESTPRIWAGYKAATGFGFRTTFWEFDGDGQTSTNVADGINIFGAHAVTVIFPATILAVVPGEQLVNSDSLKTQIINFYGTYDTTLGGFEISGGAGLRSARLEQDLNSVVTGGLVPRQLTWRRKYEGLGPAVAVDAKRRIGCTPFSMFVNGGGSFLFGRKTINRTVFGDVDPLTPPFLNLEDADEVVGIGELGLGVEWSRKLESGYNVSVRGSYEGSLWAEAGAPTLGFLGFEGFGVSIELKR